MPIDDSEVDLDNLTDKQIEALSQYYALLSNNLQDQVWGSHHYIVTEEAVQGVKNIAKLTLKKINLTAQVTAILLWLKTV